MACIPALARLYTDSRKSRSPKKIATPKSLESVQSRRLTIDSSQPSPTSTYAPKSPTASSPLSCQSQISSASSPTSSKTPNSPAQSSLVSPRSKKPPRVRVRFSDSLGLKDEVRDWVNGIDVATSLSPMSPMSPTSPTSPISPTKAKSRASVKFSDPMGFDEVQDWAQRMNTAAPASPTSPTKTKSPTSVRFSDSLGGASEEIKDWASRMSAKEKSQESLMWDGKMSSRRMSGCKSEVKTWLQRPTKVEKEKAKKSEEFKQMRARKMSRVDIEEGRIRKDGMVWAHEQERVGLGRNRMMLGNDAQSGYSCTIEGGAGTEKGGQKPGLARKGSRLIRQLSRNGGLGDV